MNPLIIIHLLLALAGQAPETGGSTRDRTAPTLRERLLKLHLDDASDYTIARDADHKEQLALRHEPVYVWTNPVRAHQQDGAVFVWTWRGRAEAIGSIFSAPAGPGLRSINHEFHSLSLAALDVAREGTHTESWTPGVAGIELSPIEGAPAPDRAAPKRLVQMRALSRDYSATSRDAKDVRWDLRLLPQPLYRYESTDPDVLDGALFAFVTSAGTDPEVLLVIEARRPPSGGEPVWQSDLARFSDLELTVRYKGAEVFTAPLIRGNLKQLYPKQQYRVFRDRGVPRLEGEAP